jgi:hypothetical protein
MEAQSGPVGGINAREWHGHDASMLGQSAYEGMVAETQTNPLCVSKHGTTHGAIIPQNVSCDFSCMREGFAWPVPPRIHMSSSQLHAGMWTLSDALHESSQIF